MVEMFQNTLGLNAILATHDIWRTTERCEEHLMTGDWDWIHTSRVEEHHSTSSPYLLLPNAR